MKPTSGKVSFEGIHPLSWSMDHIGPITKTVMDNAILFDALLKSDFNNSISRRLEVSKPKGLEGRTIGIPTSYFFDNVDKEVECGIIAAIELVKKLGFCYRSGCGHSGIG